MDDRRFRDHAAGDALQQHSRTDARASTLANLLSSMKMTTPRYQDIQQAGIPEIVDDDGTRIRVITGEFRGRKGPVDGIAAEPMYLDVSILPKVTRSLPVDTYANAFAYVFKGTASFSDSSQPVGKRMEKGIM